LLRHQYPAVAHILTRSVNLALGPKLGFKTKCRALKWGPFTTLIPAVHIERNVFEEAVCIRAQRTSCVVECSGSVSLLWNQSATPLTECRIHLREPVFVQAAFRFVACFSVYFWEKKTCVSYILFLKGKASAAPTRRPARRWCTTWRAKSTLRFFPVSKVDLTTTVLLVWPSHLDRLSNVLIWLRKNLIFPSDAGVFRDFKQRIVVFRSGHYKEQVPRQTKIVLKPIYSTTKTSAYG